MKLVLLPGLDGTGQLFELFNSIVPKGYSTYTIDYPCKRPMSYAELMEYVRGLLPRNEKYILLGESFSGPIAIKIASENPNGLIGLVLCNTFARKPWWPIFRFLPWNLILKHDMPSFVMHRMGATKDQKNLQLALQSAIGSVSPEVLGSRLKETFRIDVSQGLKSIKVPTLYLRGTTDTTVREWSLNYITRLMPEIEVSHHFVPHLLLQLVPESAWKAIDDFATKHISF